MTLTEKPLWTAVDKIILQVCGFVNRNVGDLQFAGNLTGLDLIQKSAEEWKVAQRFWVDTAHSCSFEPHKDQ